MCSLTSSTSLDEAGVVAWVLMRNSSRPATLPTPQQLLAAGSNITGLVPGTLASGSISTAMANTTVPGLASQTVYVLLLAARDAAPQPNYQSQLALLMLTAPDVTPPVFKSERTVLFACGITHSNRIAIAMDTKVLLSLFQSWPHTAAWLQLCQHVAFCISKPDSCHCCASCRCLAVTSGRHKPDSGSDT